MAVGKKRCRQGVVRKASIVRAQWDKQQGVLREEILTGGAEEWRTRYDCWLLTSPKKTILADVKSLKMTLNSKKKAGLNACSSVDGNGMCQRQPSMFLNEERQGNPPLF